MSASPRRIQPVRAACRSISPSRQVKRMTIGFVRFSSAPCFHKRCYSRIVDTTRTGSGTLPASKEHGRTFLRNEIAKTLSASALTSIARARSSNVGVSRPDTKSSRPTIWPSSSSHQSALRARAAPALRAPFRRALLPARRAAHRLVSANIPRGPFRAWRARRRRSDP
jgi:hypothetical protein